MKRAGFIQGLSRAGIAVLLGVAAGPSTAASADLAGLESLVSESTEVVIGRTFISREGLFSQGRAEWLSKFRVERVLKGELAAGATITIGRPAASSSARTSLVRHVLPEFRYLLFLRR